MLGPQNGQNGFYYLDKGKKDFRAAVNILWGPEPSEKSTFQSEILDLGSHNSLVKNVMCPHFSEKITPPYCTWTAGWVIFGNFSFSLLGNCKLGFFNWKVLLAKWAVNFGKN